VSVHDKHEDMTVPHRAFEGWVPRFTLCQVLNSVELTQANRITVFGPTSFVLTNHCMSSKAL
jgi:hypothetical protein